MTTSRAHCVLPLLMALVAAAPDALAAKMAMMGLQGGEGVTAKLAASVGDVVVAEVRKSGRTIITPKEVGAILGYEKQRQILGCDEMDCYAELGGALGVDELVSGSISKLGESWMVHLKRIDLAEIKVVAQADRRLKGGTIDDVLDVLPAMTRELISAVPKSGQSVSTALPTGDATKPSPWQEVPLANRDDLKGLSLFTLGEHIVALNLEAMNRSPLFVGSGKKFYKLRTSGSGRSGADKFTITIWDPRHRDGYKRGISHDAGVTVARCGDVTTELKSLAKRKAKQILNNAKFFEAPWARAAVAIASDDSGNYVVVDQARGSRDNSDFRMYVGSASKFRYVAVSDHIRARDRQAFITAQGQLVLATDANGKPTAKWKNGASVKTLTPLRLFDYAAKIYSTLGVYDEKRLGTFCDAADR